MTKETQKTQAKPETAPLTLEQYKDIHRIERDIISSSIILPEPVKTVFLDSRRGKDVTVGLTDKTNYRGELKEVLDIGLVINVVDRDVLICWTSIKEVF